VTDMTSAVEAPTAAARLEVILVAEPPAATTAEVVHEDQAHRLKADRHEIRE
jgi:hypothetical protein